MTTGSRLSNIHVYCCVDFYGLYAVYGYCVISQVLSWVRSWVSWVQFRRRFLLILRCVIFSGFSLRVTLVSEVSDPLNVGISDLFYACPWICIQYRVPIPATLFMRFAYTNYNEFLRDFCQMHSPTLELIGTVFLELLNGMYLDISRSRKFSLL